MPDPEYRFAFQNIRTALEVWYAMRLQALEAVTYQGRLVKNREGVTQRIQYRIENIDVQIQQRAQEADGQARLLASIDRPQALLAGQLISDKSGPLVDAGTLDQLIKNNYVGPLVARISALQEDKLSLASERTRLQRQLAWLPQTRNVDIHALPTN